MEKHEDQGKGLDQSYSPSLLICLQIVGLLMPAGPDEGMTSFSTSFFYRLPRHMKCLSGRGVNFPNNKNPN